MRYLLALLRLTDCLLCHVQTITTIAGKGVADLPPGMYFVSIPAHYVPAVS
jgi:hypothetical protein